MRILGKLRSLSRAIREAYSTQTALRVVLNSVILGVFGSGVWFWSKEYTNWAAQIGSILLVFGTVLGLPFLTRRVSDELRERVERLLANRRVPLLALFFLPVFIFAASFIATIEIRNTDNATVSIAILTPEEAGSRTLIASGKYRNFPRFVPWDASTILVRAKDHPMWRGSLGPFSKRELVVPTSFWERAVVLLRPDPQISLTLLRDHLRASQEFDLLVEISETAGHKSWVLDGGSYWGQTLWIGCDESVRIPADLMVSWPQLTNNDPDLLALWQRPLAVGVSELLGPDAHVKATLLGPSGTFASAETTLKDSIPAIRNIVEVTLR